MIRLLTEADVEFTVECQAEDTSPAGSFATGDDALDEQLVNDIARDLDNGNEWAWCVVRVSATWKGFEGEDYLGGCSYKNAADFKVGPYFEQMKAEALDNLNVAVGKAYADIVTDLAV